MSSNKDDVLRQFCDVTGMDESRSRFFLDSSNWQLDIALSSFYEHGGNVDEGPANQAEVASVPYITSSDMDSPTGSPLQPQKSEKKKQSSNTKFATLDSLQQESSSDEEGEAFYAGGSERSGQQILGPGKGRHDVVADMFKSVRERGAVVFEDEPSSTSQGRVAFGGVGYRLGQTADDHEQVKPPTSQSQQQENQPRLVRLHMYREGFTIDNGPLRAYTNPENAELLNCIRHGKIPPELADGGGEVRVSMEDRRHTEYTEPRNKSKPFAGKGHLLGSPTPPTVGSPAPDESDRAANLRAAQDAVALDARAPATTVQFRLLDGRRLTGRFNHSHTVGTLVTFVTTAEPQYRQDNLVLCTAFPTAELSDLTLTLEEAKLLNSTLMLRTK